MRRCGWLVGPAKLLDYRRKCKRVSPLDGLLVSHMQGKKKAEPKLRNVLRKINSLEGMSNILLEKVQVGFLLILIICGRSAPHAALR